MAATKKFNRDGQDRQDKKRQLHHEAHEGNEDKNSAYKYLYATFHVIILSYFVCFVDERVLAF